MERSNGLGSYRRIAYIFIGLGVAILLAVGIFVGFGSLKAKAVIPKDVASQLEFSPFVILHPDDHDVQVSSHKYDKTNKTYTYIVRLNDSQQLTISEQASPTNFEEIPDLYTKLVDGLGKYDSVSTANGTVQLTRPKEGKQVAVLNQRGVLLFARANENDLTKAQWKSAIELLDVYKSVGKAS